MAYKFIDAVLWYRNLGGAEEIKFGPPQDVCKSGTCKYACGVACADLNGDGRVDVCRLRGNQAVSYGDVASMAWGARKLEFHTGRRGLARRATHEHLLQQGKCARTRCADE